MRAEWRSQKWKIAKIWNRESKWSIARIDKLSDSQPWYGIYDYEKVKSINK
jgi:hypothetical protein